MVNDGYIIWLYNNNLVTYDDNNLDIFGYGKGPIRQEKPRLIFSLFMRFRDFGHHKNSASTRSTERCSTLGHGNCSVHGRSRLRSVQRRDDGQKKCTGLSCACCLDPRKV